MDHVQALSHKLKKPNRAWVRPLEEGAGARYHQIADLITRAVRDGVLRAGDRLPPQRDLAHEMGVDLTTVTRAYNEVRLAGLLDARGAGGTESPRGDSQGLFAIAETTAALTNGHVVIKQRTNPRKSLNNKPLFLSTAGRISSSLHRQGQ